MNHDSQEDRVALFRRLFVGREDVYAYRWERADKSGYSPAYSFDPYMFRLHKARGGTFQEYPDKSLAQFTDDVIKDHLEGRQVVGTYPLLKDHTTRYIVADFDKSNWQEECRKFIKTCRFFQTALPFELASTKQSRPSLVSIFVCPSSV